MVTQQQFTNIYGSNPSQMTKAKTGDVVAHRPVDKVAYTTANKTVGVRSSYSPRDSIVSSSSGTFLQRLNYKTGLYFDLPTEVMFEIAERAGATTAYSWGDSYDVLTNYCICVENTGGTQAGGNYTSAVGSKLPNVWGLYDTAGNVWEWTRDHNNLTNLGNATDPFVPSQGTSNNYRLRGYGTANDSMTSSTFQASYRATSGNGAGWNRSFRVSHVVED